MELTENLYHQINELEAEVARLKAENKRLQDKCNRMVRSAAIEDITGRAGDR